MLVTASLLGILDFFNSLSHDLLGLGELDELLLDDDGDDDDNNDGERLRLRPMPRGESGVALALPARFGPRAA